MRYFIDSVYRIYIYLDSVGIFFFCVKKRQFEYKKKCLIYEINRIKVN